MVSDEVKDVIKDYYFRCYSYRLIHYLLESRHDYRISFSYLQKKVIPSLGLRRRGSITDTDLNDIFKQAVLEVSNGVGGAEQLRRTLTEKHRLRITRQLSRDLVSLIDREGVSWRKRHRLRRRKYFTKGPNYAWHLDGYDKLAPYGICIHGCIDGFSRKIIWLKAGITNRRPEVVAQYFLEAAIEEGGFPRKLRGDCGTENGLVARIQQQARGEEDAFIYGRSTSNQRIERWWGHLRNARSDFWIHQFKLLQQEDLLMKDSLIHRLSVQYSFLPFIQKQLNEVRDIWNSHSIRNQKNGDSLPGIPDVLHTECQLYGVRNYIHPVTDQHIQQWQQWCNNNFLMLDQDFCAVAKDISDNFGLPDPEDIEHFEDAKDLYVVISCVMENLF